MNAPQAQFVISIMSRDHVGIIYQVSKALSDLDGNIAQVRQSVLCGYFTMILLATFPSQVTQRDIERKLAEADARSETPLEATVRKAEDFSATATASEKTYILTRWALSPRWRLFAPSTRSTSSIFRPPFLRGPTS